MRTVWTCTFILLFLIFFFIHTCCHIMFFKFTLVHLKEAFTDFKELLVSYTVRQYYTS